MRTRYVATENEFDSVFTNLNFSHFIQQDFQIPVGFIIIWSADSGHLQMCFIDMNACQKKISFGMKRTEPATSHEIGSKHKRRYSETTS